MFDMNGAASMGMLINQKIKERENEMGIGTIELDDLDVQEFGSEKVMVDNIRDALLKGIKNYVPESTDFMRYWSNEILKFMAEYFGEFWVAFVIEYKMSCHTKLVENASSDGLLIFIKAILDSDNENFIVPMVNSIITEGGFDFIENREQLKCRVDAAILKRVELGIKDDSACSSMMSFFEKNPDFGEGRELEDRSKSVGRAEELKQRQKESALSLKRDIVDLAFEYTADVINGNNAAIVSLDNGVFVLKFFDIRSIGSNRLKTHNYKAIEVLMHYDAWLKERDDSYNYGRNSAFGQRLV